MINLTPVSPKNQYSRTRAKRTKLGKTLFSDEVKWTSHAKRQK